MDACPFLDNFSRLNDDMGAQKKCEWITLCVKQTLNMQFICVNFTPKSSHKNNLLKFWKVGWEVSDMVFIQTFLGGNRWHM